MADFKSKTKKRGGLGAPPPPTETKGNLETPETFDTPVETPTKRVGRPKSNRTVPLTTKLTPEFRDKLRRISYEEGKNIGQIIEEAVNYWERNKQ